MAEDLQEKNYIEDKSPKFNSEVLTIALIIAAIIGIFIFLLISTDSSFKWAGSNKIQVITFVLSFFIGICGNILSSILWQRRLIKKMNRKQNTQIVEIRNLGDPNLTNTILHDIKSYNNRSIDGYNVTVRLLKYKKDNNSFHEKFILVKVKLKYTKRIYNKSLIFQFVRNRGIDDQKNLVRQKLENEQTFFKNEFYYIFDERSFGNLKEQERIYQLDNLKINQHDVKFKEVKDKNIIEFSAALPSNIHVGDLISIEYDITFVMESESYLFFVVELPSKGAYCDLFYEDVSDMIEISAHDFLTAKKSASFEHEEKQWKFQIYTDDWVLPKSNFFFTWYEK